MRTICLALLFLSSFCLAFSQSGPTDAKAQKTYADAQALLKQNRSYWALEAFKKADKQDGGHCRDCAQKIFDLALATGDYKTAAASAAELIASAKTPAEIAEGHALRAAALFREASLHHKENLFPEVDSECKTALGANPHDLSALYLDGVALSWLKQDDAARAQFQQVIQLTRAGTSDQKRAQRMFDHPELARARMAPPFSVKTIDDREVSLDDLAGKVVLIDFWATWCGPCREALPHLRKIARNFSNEPLVVISISLDKDEKKWRDFVTKNEMTWVQARVDGFEGDLAKRFSVEAIPHTFTIDADGVLQDEHIGDASIEGKLKKQIARAKELQPTNQAKGQ